MTKLVADAAKEFDPTKRAGLYKQIQQLALSDLPQLYLLAVPVRLLHQGAGLLRHASRQHAPRSVWPTK